jgi:hypothetical protein
MINNLGVDPNEWFDTPHNDKEEPYITDEYAPCDVEYDLENPDESDDIESSKESDNIHEEMYQMAIKNGGSWLGGSENLGGGSEERLEEEFTPENDPYGGY